jgi:4a-hydroxytetrahydrobiopterin dehydratase
MKRLSEEEQQRYVHDQLDLHWSIVDNALKLRLEFESLQEVHELLTRLSREANEQNHHPDMVVNAKVVEVSLTTHDASGITILDFKFAKAVETHYKRILSFRAI